MKKIFSQYKCKKSLKQDKVFQGRWFFDRTDTRAKGKFIDIDLNLTYTAYNLNMKFYNKHILPRLIDSVCSQDDISMIRRKLVPRAKGVTLEVGMGSGLNLPFYDPSRIDVVLGLEPNEQLRKITEKKARDVPFDVDFIGLTGEEIPLESNFVDTVVVTFTLCSIPDAFKALKEMKRVLKSSGELIFCEHGKSPDDHIFKWQNRLNHPWTKVSGGCHLNRKIPEMIRKSGFKIVSLDAGYNSPLKLLSFNYKGVAVPE